MCQTLLFDFSRVWFRDYPQPPQVLPPMMYIMQKKIHSHVNGGKIKHAYGWYVLILIEGKGYG